MTLSQTAQQLIAEAEALSGYPVAVVDDADLPTPAALRMARGQSAMHLISLQAGASRARETAGGGGESITFVSSAASSCASSPARRTNALT